MEKDLDKKLYNDYLSGEKEAFEYLYNKYKSKIVYFIFNIVKDYQKAEDLTQEIFIYIMQNPMKSDVSFKYYIYLVAKSKAFNYINIENRRTEITDMYLNNSKQIEKDVLEVITQEETKKEILDAISFLEEKYKNAVYLTKIENLSYKEVSEILGETLSNTKSLVHRGKKQLKRILLKKGFDEMNKVAKVFVIVFAISIFLAGGVFASVKIYESIKSYYLEDNVKEPITNSEAPVGEIVFKQFNIKNNEPKVEIETWQKNNQLYYRKITEYSEYKELMDKYSNLRKLDEKDFDNYFAFIILNEDISKDLDYKFITYEDISDDEKIMQININLKDNGSEEIEKIGYTGLVVIMTNWHKDFIIMPKIKE